MMKRKNNKINYIIWSVTAVAAVVWAVVLSVLWINTSLAAVGDPAVDAAVGNLLSDKNPPVEQAQSQDRTGPVCGPYAMMEIDLYALGYNVIGTGQVNNQGDQWILFQQIVGPEPLKWVMLLYINEGYEYEGGPPAGTACEIIVGINWTRYSPINQESE